MWCKMQGRMNYDGESDDFIEYVHQSTTSKLLKQTSHPYKLWFSDYDIIFEIISLWSDERVRFDFEHLQRLQNIYSGFEEGYIL